MNADKIRAKLLNQRPDLAEIIEPAILPFDQPFNAAPLVDEKDLSLAAWDKAETCMSSKKDVLSEDAIREMFSQRPLNAPQSPTSSSSLGIVRAVKKSRFAIDAHEESKDFIVDEKEGLLGSQG